VAAHVDTTTEQIPGNYIQPAAEYQGTTCHTVINTFMSLHDL